MKFHNLCRLMAAVVVTGAAIASCTDEVPPIPSHELYTREFVKRFGNVDKSHTWNGSRRASVDVTTERPSRIVISGIIAGKRYLLADYADVNGSQKLAFDMPVGYDDIRVTDGYDEVFTKVGSKVSFATRGRAIWDGADGIDHSDPNDVVKVERTSTSENWGGEFPGYRDITDEAVLSYRNYLPEGVNNLGKVMQNFMFVSNGDPFTIFPVYWQTDSYNTLGIYYFKEDSTTVYVPFYTNKIAPIDGTQGNLIYQTKEVVSTGFPGATIDKFTRDYISWNPSNYNESDKTSFYDFDEEDWAFFEKKQATDMKSSGMLGVQSWWINWKEDYPELLDHSDFSDFTVDHMEYEVVSANSVKITSIHLAPIEEDVRLEWVYPEGQKESYPQNITPVKWQSRGIKVTVKAGVKFGMYLRAENAPGPTTETVKTVEVPHGQRDPLQAYAFSEAPGNGKYYRWHSNADRNDDEKAHAATYLYTAPNGRQYRVLGFEDYNDMDLNDMIFFIDYDDPDDFKVVDEDPGETLEWIVACEDLGNLDDFDFNDVVFSVRHVAGREMAYITPLAAGGTLETYLYYRDDQGRDNCLADLEWHEHFGVYDYTQMLNTRGGVTHKARERGVQVGKDFTLSPMLHSGTIDNPASLSSTELKENMGGLHVHVVREDGMREDITPPSRTGEAPQMFLIPQLRYKVNADGTLDEEGNYSYKWQWPIERHAIELAYPRFSDWIKNSFGNTDWHLDRKEGHTVSR